MTLAQFVRERDAKDIPHQHLLVKKSWFAETKTDEGYVEVELLDVIHHTQDFILKIRFLTARPTYPIESIEWHSEGWCARYEIIEGFETHISETANHSIGYEMPVV